MAKKSSKSVAAVVESTEQVVAQPEVVVETEVLVEDTNPTNGVFGLDLAGMLMTEVKPLHDVEAKDEVVVKVPKNEGVGNFVRKLIAEGQTNTAILKIVHEQYGNKQTTYACVAWYRNKMKKTAVAKAQTSAVESVEKFLEADTTEATV